MHPPESIHTARHKIPPSSDIPLSLRRVDPPAAERPISKRAGIPAARIIPINSEWNPCSCRASRCKPKSHRHFPSRSRICHNASSRSRSHKSRRAFARGSEFHWFAPRKFGNGSRQRTRRSGSRNVSTLPAIRCACAPVPPFSICHARIPREHNKMLLAAPPEK